MSTARRTTMSPAGLALAAALASATLIGPGAAAPPAAGQPAPAPAGPAQPAPVPAEPQQTVASFGDWAVRCARPPGVPRRVCEAAQSLVIQGQQAPVAQIAFGHVLTEKGLDPALTLTVLLPNNVSFDKQPRLSGTDENGGAALTYRRCLPGGCVADVKPAADLIKDLRTTGKPGRLTFTDAAERTLTLPVSYRGLAQALDDLAKETAKDAS